MSSSKECPINGMDESVIVKGQSQVSLHLFPCFFNQSAMIEITLSVQ